MSAPWHFAKQRLLAQVGVEHVGDQTTHVGRFVFTAKYIAPVMILHIRMCTHMRYHVSLPNCTVATARCSTLIWLVRNVRQQEMRLELHFARTRHQSLIRLAQANLHMLHDSCCTLHSCSNNMREFENLTFGRGTDDN